MKKLFLKVLVTSLLTTSLAFGLSVSTMAAASTTKSYTGFLIDAKCGVAGYDQYHKLNIKKYPAKHTTACLKMSHCMDSGLGISIKQSNGTYKYYKFDKAGSKKADDTIMMMTKKKFNLKISVKGKISGKTITISSVKEVM